MVLCCFFLLDLTDFRIVSLIFWVLLWMIGGFLRHFFRGRSPFFFRWPQFCWRIFFHFSKELASEFRITRHDGRVDPVCLYRVFLTPSGDAPGGLGPHPQPWRPIDFRTRVIDWFFQSKPRDHWSQCFVGFCLFALQIWRRPNSSCCWRFAAAKRNSSKRYRYWNVSRVFCFLLFYVFLFGARNGRL